MTDLLRAEVIEALANLLEMKGCPDIEPPWRAAPGYQYYNECAKAIRSFDLSEYRVTVPEDDEELLETLREEAELHCVSVGQGFEQSYVTEERALMHLLVRAANRIESLAAQVAERDWQIRGYQKECHDVEMELGKALGYPRFCDDQKNFPGATEESGCCIGEHTPASIAMEAAEKLAEYKRRIAELEGKG